MKFVIVASEFSGDIASRIASLDNEGIAASFLSARLLRLCAATIQELSYSDIKMLNLHNIFARSPIDREHLEGCFDCDLVEEGA
jgi:hypothetical protein